MCDVNGPPLVSVVIPTYNRAAYIVQAVESVLAQRRPALEVIVVDDGSTDDTRQRLGPYFDRITYIARANAGVSAARNTAMRRVRGDLVAFLDSDDIWEPFKLESQVRFLCDHPDVGLICSDFSAFDDNGLFRRSYAASMFPVFAEMSGHLNTVFDRCERVSIEGDTVNVYCGMVFDMMVRGYFTLTSTVVMRKILIEECGYFDESLNHSEDYDYYLRISRHHCIAYMDLPTVRYRLGHADQLSGGDFASRRHIAGLRNWLTLAERIRQNDREYYLAHRLTLNRIIAERRMWVAHALYGTGDYAAAARGFLRAIAVDPTRVRLYGYCARAGIRAGGAALRRSPATAARQRTGRR